MARSGISGTAHGLTHIRVPERGYIDIDQDIWSILQASQDFRRLHAEGVVEVVYRPLGKVRLKGTCYVGHAICADVLIEFCEKVDGALGTLLAFASNNAFKLTRAKAATSGLNDLIALLISQFLNAVTAYTSSGRKFQYATRKSAGSLVGGKLDITKSIQLRARGLGHLLAFEKNVVTFSTPINRVVLAALSEVERLDHLVRLPEGAVAKSRSLSMIFSDCRDHEILYRERSYFATKALRMAESESDDLVKDMMSLAGVILSQESFGSASGRPTGLPRTWFLNLEALFETAVRDVLGEICTQATVFRGGVSPQAIFDREQGEYRANPDIVVSANTGWTAVGDVKYKIFDGSAAAGDIYQLLAHAEAFGASRAFLIFPGESYFMRSLGSSRGGIDTAFFSVRLQYIREDLATMAAHLGFHVPALIELPAAPQTESAASTTP